MREVHHEVDFCVVGGGMAGVCAAIAAARKGVKVVLLQDRPVLGGNASSEIRMWICGAHGPNNRETGILEEMQLENLYRNNTCNYSIWDSIVYEKVRFQKNITLLLNCSCTEVEMCDEGSAVEGYEKKIKSIKGWQMTTETWHSVSAKVFSDCSGDSILAPLSGAEFRVGREASKEYKESIAPKVSDKKTMGISCLFQVRETDRPQKFTPPSWANKYINDSDFPEREHHFKTNFWWIELGGDKDSISDTEEIRDELLKIVFGVWDHIKNHGDHEADNYVIDWIGFLPGKRESRRYIGDHVITQNDIEDGGKFDDIVAYGGWSMDDHFPAGMNYKGGYPTLFHFAPSPYGIPYRSLYSKNIENLFFAGRNISATHSAMSSTRVMGTCSVIGQAVGVAASIAVRRKLTPRGVYQKEIRELQKLLKEADCYLPGQKREIPKLSRNASLFVPKGDADMLRNGIDRPVGDATNSWTGNIGDRVVYNFEKNEKIKEVRLIFDSNLNRKVMNVQSVHLLNEDRYVVQPQMVKDFTIEVFDESGGWTKVADIKGNYQRLVRVKMDVFASAVRFVAKATWGDEKVNIFAFDVR
ncbi:MAG: FAD-dependent oxidoreductase [Bacillota bacterium]